MHHIGDKFGRLTIISEREREKDKSGHPRYYYQCECDCGNKVRVNGSDLASGSIKSCGCLRKENISKNKNFYIWKSIVESQIQDPDKLKEYRVTASLVLSQAAKLLRQLYILFVKLENDTREERTFTQDVEKRKRIVKVYTIDPLSSSKVCSFVSENGYLVICKMVYMELKSISNSSVKHEWVLDYIKQNYSHFPKYEHYFEKCAFDSEKEFGTNLLVIKNAIDCCLEFGTGDPSNVSNIIGFVAYQAELALKYIIDGE